MESSSENQNRSARAALELGENPEAATASAKRRKVDDGPARMAENGGAQVPTDAVTPPTVPPPPIAISKFQVGGGLTNQNKKDGIPNWRRVQEMLLSEEAVAKVLIEKEIIQVPRLCPKCHQELKFPTKGVRLRCKKCYSRNGGEWSQSLLKGTFFEFGRLKVHDMLMFLYHWLCGAKHKQLCLLMGWSNSTMFRWVSYAQELVAAVTFYHQIEDYSTNHPVVKIGGQDVVVQIDDCSFDKRHCQHPEYVKGGWIFCGVEVTPKRRFFSCVVADQSPERWMTLVRKYIAAGSIIKSHNWTSNNVMDIKAGSQYRHRKKHQNLIPFDSHFVNPFQVDTDAVARNNRAFAAAEDETWIVPEEPSPATTTTPAGNATTPTTTPHRKHNNVKELQGSLFEFIWRKKHEANLWNALLWTIKEVKYEL